MNIRIIERAATNIAYWRYVGPYGEPVAQFWQNVYVPWAIANKLGPDHARYGISHDDPSVTPAEQCRYDACAEVPSDFTNIGGAATAVLPGGKYAVLDFRGSPFEILSAWRHLMFDWLPNSGYQLDSRPCFEHYPKGSTSDDTGSSFSCEICISIVSV